MLGAWNFEEDDDELDSWDIEEDPSEGEQGDHTAVGSEGELDSQDTEGGNGRAKEAAAADAVMDTWNDDKVGSWADDGSAEEEEGDLWETTDDFGPRRETKSRAAWPL